MNAPLADLRVIAVEQYGAGPFSTMQLADLGAEVIKIENPREGGDVGRSIPPYASERDSLFFQSLNRNKRSVVLDIAAPAGRSAFESLVREADAVFYNLRGDAAAKLGLRYEDLREVNPKIVCCSLSGFGLTGPRAAQPGYDYLIQGLAGWMSMTGEPDAPPAKSGLSLVDISTGYVAALALVAAVWRARRDGAGCDCDISLLETAIAELTYIGTWVATADYVPARHSHSAHPSIVPFQLFATADGHVVVACAKEKFYARLCEALGTPELASEERFATMAARERNREELVARLAELFAAASTAEWVERLTAAGVPNGPVNDVAAALADPQVIARGGVVELPDETWGTVRHVATPLRVGEEPAPLRRAPAYGEDTEQVLGELAGLDSEALAALRAEGLIEGDASPAGSGR
ncbi:MAG: CoA transferase [Actinobacteria bacterium]|nr:CoA transferase [Actinomycetota bacterium]